MTTELSFPLRFWLLKLDAAKISRDDQIGKCLVLADDLMLSLKHVHEERLELVSAAPPARF